MSVKRYQPVAQCVEPSYQAQMVEPKVMEFSEGEYVRWEDYDATCETLAHTETERDASDAEVQRLKAEVENSKRINTELLVLSKRQASDIRRLTKAGDAMLSEWSSGDEKDANNFCKALVIWNTAKQRGPTE